MGRKLKRALELRDRVTDSARFILSKTKYKDINVASLTPEQAIKVKKEKKYIEKHFKELRELVINGENVMKNVLPERHIRILRIAFTRFDKYEPAKIGHLIDIDGHKISRLLLHILDWLKEAIKNTT